jgi:triosephosphate isomerase
LREIRKCVGIAKENNLISVCCAPKPAEAKSIARFNPDFIAIEPPELIGSGISVSAAKPEVVTNSIKQVRLVNRRVKVLCGAGVTNGGDVKKALELGTRGILVASGVVKAKNPEKVLRDFVKSI